MEHGRLVTVEDYEPLIGAEAVDRIMGKAQALRGLHVANVNSTYYGGGVAEILRSLTLLMNASGIRTGWRIIQGVPDFFNITKKMHNALQGDRINLSERKKRLYEEVIFENSVRNHLGHNMVIVHDPQPLPLVEHYRKHGPWIWRCHLDLTDRDAGLWKYLTRFIEQYDAVILTSPEHRQKLATPQLFFPPAIDPFSILNREMDRDEIERRLAHYHIPTDLPIVTQISRFDRWKDPRGTIEAFRIARKEVDATLVLLGNIATDDPEGKEVYESLLDCQGERILIMSHQDTSLVNALQRSARVVVQKSLREGFGLTVAEAMWKGAAVVGGDTSGIRHQITDGENGFLVSSVEQAASRIVQLLKDKRLKDRLGRAARQTVKKHFLLPRYMEQYLDLFGSFETIFRLRPNAYR